MKKKKEAISLVKRHKVTVETELFKKDKKVETFWIYFSKIEVIKKFLITLPRNNWSVKEKTFKVGRRVEC